MSRKFSKKISTNELESIILKTLEKKENVLLPTGTKLVDLDFCNNRELADCVDKMQDYDRSYKNLTSTIEKDLAKVEFDVENVSIVDEYGEGSLDGLLGLNTLPNGLAFLGFNAGGDWETPIFYIIYFDGSKLRGYIPTEGNPWNTKNKMAYGNDDEEDNENAIKRGWTSFDSACFDSNKIKQDIMSRILEK